MYDGVDPPDRPGGHRDREPRPKILTPQVPGTHRNRRALRSVANFTHRTVRKGPLFAAEPRQIMVRVERP
jgi:hypothetical protein